MTWFLAAQMSSKKRRWKRENKAGYTATEVTCGCAEAIFEVTRPCWQEQWGQRNKIIKKSKVWPTDRPTDQPTDRPTDKAGCRVACTRLKTNFLFLFQNYIVWPIKRTAKHSLNPNLQSKIPENITTKSYDKKYTKFTPFLHIFQKPPLKWFSFL